MNGLREQPPRRPHVLMVPFAPVGHFYPFLQLLYECALYEGVTVTVVSNEQRISELRGLQAKGEFNDLDLRLETVFVAGLPKDDSNPKFPGSAWASSQVRRLEFAPFVDRLIQTKDPSGGPTCLVADNLTAVYTQAGASRLGIPWYPVVVATPGYLTSYFESPMLRELRDQSSPGGHEPLDIPGLEFARVRDLPGEIFFSPLDYVSCQADIFSRASALVINTAAELDAPSGTLEGIRMSMKRRASAENRQAPRIFCVGPMLNFPGFRGLAENSSLQTAPHTSLASLSFLDGHPPASVLYICFGSFANISPESVTELAHGLEASGVPFLWVLRMRGYSSAASLVPEGFQNRLKGRGFIEEGWAPQAEILLHPSIGGYVCHCGWNSVNESFCTAVPLITWPIGAEQQLSARFVEKIAKTGIAVRHFAPDKEAHETTWEVLPTRSDVQRAVTFLMTEEGGKELRKNARQMKKIVTEAVAANGSSQSSLRMFLGEILLHSIRRIKQPLH